MGFFSRFKAPPPIEPPTHVCSPEKALLQIARFENAIAQATNPRKRNLLNQWLAYYRNLASVERP